MGCSPASGTVFLHLAFLHLTFFPIDCPEAMMRYCFTSRVDPRHLDRYRERHAAVWPEMLTALRDSGWRNYSLFLADTGVLIGYFEADDKDLVQARMAATDINAQWQAEMADLFTGDGNPDEGFTYVPEVFNLNDQLVAAGLPVDPGPSTNPA